jgi:hypothetical protein
MWYGPASLGLLVGLSLLVAACGSAPVTETVSPVATPAAGASPGDVEQAPEGPEIPKGAEEMVDLVLMDLAEQLQVPKAEIQIVSIEAMEWRNSSLGCPKPGLAYLDVISPGYRIVLEVSGREHIYHTGPAGFVLCEKEPELSAKEGTRQADEEALDAEMQAMVQESKKDLSQRLNIGTEEILLASAESVEWRDSSMGCPQPGMNYLMVITPGYLIKLEAKGKTYHYHAGADSPFFCKNPQAPLRSSSLEEQPAVDAAKAELAKRLSVAAGEIQVVRTEAVDWPDASMGCPKPGKMYAQVVTPGYKVLLSAGGKQYDYRATSAVAILCEK